VSLGFVRRVTPTGDTLLTQTYLAIHEAYSALKSKEEPMINTPCRFYQLVAEWSFFETGAGTSEPAGTCNNPPTAYVELGGQRAGTLLGRVCQAHGDALMNHPGYRSIQALREPAGKHTNSGGCDD